MTLSPGATLGRYQILAPIGQGGMATVYRAYQPALDRVVVLKVIRTGLDADPDFIERFAREAKAVARLRHPHIVQVFDFEQEPTPFMAMEYLDGGTLKGRLDELARESGRLPQREAARIVAEVAEALGYAAANGIIHRDIKPSNILLTRDGKAVVGDFGIAKILAGVTTTQTGVGIGTPEYMSPEQGQGRAVDQRSDLYSLGAVAYELLTGQVPFRADTPLAVVFAHVRAPIPLPSAINPQIGPQTERALLRALAKAPEDRFATAPEFAERLTRAITEDDRGTVGTVIRRQDPAAAAARPRALTVPLTRTVLAAGIVAGLILIGGGAAAVLGVFGAGAGRAGDGVAEKTAASSVSGANTGAAGTAAPTPSRSGAAAAISSNLPTPTPPDAAATTPQPQSVPTPTLPPPTPAPTQPPPPATFNPAAAAYRITGRVTSAVTGGPLSGFQVNAFPADSCCPSLASARTDGAGGFSLAVGGGNYRVQVTPDTSTGYAQQFWQGAISNTDGSVISVSGTNVGQIDFVMQPGFLVSGTVTSASTGAPVSNAFVNIRTNDHVWGGPTDSAGRWQARLVNSSYLIEFYQSSPCCSGQLPVQTVQVTISGKDAVVNGQVR